MMENPCRVVYLGNLANVASGIESLDGVRLAGWIAEEGDEIWAGTESVLSCRATSVKSLSDLKRAFESFGPFDLGVIANFGLILSEEILAFAPKGFVNVHFGLLPDRPGRHPILQALDADDPVVGMTLHRVVSKPDAGPVIAFRSFSAGTKKDPAAIFERMAFSAPSFLSEHLPTLLR